MDTNKASLKKYHCSVNILSRNLILFILIFRKNSVESTEVSEGIVLDYDDEGKLVGIDIDNASSKVKLKELIINRLPSESKKIMV